MAVDGGNFRGRQDEENKIEIVRTYEEERYICRRFERLVMRSFRKGRRTSKKHWGDVISHDITHLSLLRT